MRNVALGLELVSFGLLVTAAWMTFGLGAGLAALGLACGLVGYAIGEERHR
jgi:hypothetical protein